MEKGLEKASELLLNISLAHGTGLSSDEIKNAPQKILKNYPELANYYFIDPTTTGQGQAPKLLIETYAPKVLRVLDTNNEGRRQKLVQLIQIMAGNLVKAISKLLTQADNFIREVEETIKERDKNIKTDMPYDVYVRSNAIDSIKNFIELRRKQLLIIKAVLEYSRNENHRDVAKKIDDFLSQIEDARQKALQKLNLGGETY